MRASLSMRLLGARRVEMLCCTGKHDWIDPVSAARCCVTGWSRELRFGVSDRVPGDADDGVSMVHAGGGQMYVWHFDGDDDETPNAGIHRRP